MKGIIKEQYIQGLDEYIRQGEPQEQERGRAWQTTSVAVTFEKVFAEK